MKFSGALTGSFIAALLTPALACVQAWGDIYIGSDGEVGLDIIVTDNGGRVCSATDGWRYDQDGHYSIKCRDGYVYAVTQDGKRAWYGYPGQAFSWEQKVTTFSTNCNPGKREWCFDLTWNTFNYC